jgi:hypothetical protein
MVAIGSGGLRERARVVRPVVGRRVGLARGGRRLRLPAGRAGRRVSFRLETTRQVRTGGRLLGDWLGGAAMLVAAAAWSTALALLAH